MSSRSPLSDSYRTLGLREGAKITEVKAAYRKLVKEWHPDQFHSVPDKARIANEQLKQINQAFDALEEHITEGLEEAWTAPSAPPTVSAADALYQAGLEFNLGAPFGTFYRSKAARKEALRCFEAAAALGHAAAQFEAGKLYEESANSGLKSHWKKAADYYVTSAKSGCQPALDRLNNYSAWEDAFVSTPDSRLSWLERLANVGIVPAQLELARKYCDHCWRGTWHPTNLPEAEKWYLRVAAVCPEVSCEIASFYEEWSRESSFGDVQIEQARVWFSRAANRSTEPKILYATARFFLRWAGRNHPQYPETASALLSKASELGHGGALAWLEDLQRLIELEATSQATVLAWLSESDGLVATDSLFDRASEIWIGAIPPEHPRELVDLVRHLYAIEILQDEFVTKPFACRAAEILSECYANGVGIDQDLGKAERWRKESVRLKI